jgi:PAS domain S-box-containing protein/putative nucleotidyltransferase with HDIG domain
MKKKTLPEIGNPQPIRILVIEDSEDDVLLIMRELKKSGYDPVYEQVETEAAIKKALKEKEWDIILCDYNLPKLKGPTAITLLKEADIDIPIIIVSGTIGEEKAVECMRLGAQDYILKTNFSRLCPAIARELKELKVRESKILSEAQRKAALEKLHHSEERYRKITRCSPDMIWTMDLSGQFTYVNEAVKRTHGWTADEFLKLNTKDVVSPQQFVKNSALIGGELAKAVDPNYDRNVIFSYESEEVRKDGSTFWAEINAMSLWSNDGKPIGIIGITRDITERKRAHEILEKSEAQYRLLADNIKDFIWVMDLDLRFKYMSASVQKTSGYTADEMKELSLDKILPEESLQRALEIFSVEMSNIEKNNPPPASKRSTELEFRCKDGHIIWIDATLSFIRDENGNPVSILGESRDITERKRTEKLLREREDRLRGITENLPGVIFQFYAKDNGEYGITYISEPRDEFAKIISNLDMANMDTVSPEFLYLLHEDDREEFLTSIKTAVETVSRWNFEGRVSVSSDKMIWVQAISSPTRIKDQTIFNGVLLNITERKLAEEKSNLSEEKFHNIFMATPNCIFISRMRYGLLIEANKGFEDIIGWKRHKVIGKKYDEFSPGFWVNPSARKLMVKELKAGKDIMNREIEFRRADGSLRTGLYSARPFNIFGESHLIFILQDITEHKLAEEKFHKIFMTTPDCITITRLSDGLMIDVNKGFEDIVGWNREFAIGTKSTEPPLNFWIDLSARDFMTAELKAGREILHREFKFRRADNAVRSGIYSARTINIENEEYVIFIMLDITEQKRMDAELRRTLESLRNAVGTTIQVMISAIEMRDPYTAGHQSRVADIARAIATEMGLSQEKIDGIRMAGTIHDIGKLSIPAEILSKPTKLTNLEYSLIKEHSQNGFEMLQNVESPWPLAEIVHQHHERINGTGYPQGLKGDEIILEARILAVADVVEAMSSHRPYRASLGIEKALDEIANNKGILYDEIAVNACLKLFREKGYKIP